MNNIPLKRTIKQLKRTKKQLKRTVKQLKRTIKQLELTGFETVGRGDSIYQNYLILWVSVAKQCQKVVKKKTKKLIQSFGVLIRRAHKPIHNLSS